MLAASRGCRRNLNIQGLHALDIRTCKEDGTAWDFNKAADRQLARDLIERLEPTWLICSPPCTALSKLYVNLNFPRMPKEVVDEKIRKGRRHLRFVISLCRLQLEHNRHVLFEHPSGANSRDDDWMIKLLQHPKVQTTISDKCEYGLVTPSAVTGQPIPAQKPTRWATSSPQMLSRLSKRCSRTHEHQPLLGGRAADAAFYPMPLITEILRGIRHTDDAAAGPDDPVDSDLARSMMPGALFHDAPKSVVAYVNEENLASDHKHRSTKLRMGDGSTQRIPLHRHVREQYRDEYTNESLPRPWVESAIHEELNYFNERVWHAVPLQQALDDPDGKIIGSRWIISNKNDMNDPDIRARLVAQEVGTHADSSFYAATPPLESKRMLFSEWATRRSRNGKPLKLSFVDIRKAYFHGVPTRSLYIRMPPEMGMGKGMVAKLEKCMYGTRDAGAIWEAVYTDALVAMGFKQGVASPCCFHHADLDSSVVVHGDDFTALAIDSSLDDFETELQKYFEVKLKGKLGQDDGDMKQMRVINRILRVCPEGLLYEPDPRHVELLAQAFNFNVTTCNSPATPRQSHEGENMQLN